MLLFTDVAVLTNLWAALGVLVLTVGAAGTTVLVRRRLVASTVAPVVEAAAVEPVEERPAAEDAEPPESR